MRTACFLSVLSLAAVHAGTAARSMPLQVLSPIQPAFDVVSIHPVEATDDAYTHISISARNGTIRAVNVNLEALMEVV